MSKSVTKTIAKRSRLDEFKVNKIEKFSAALKVGDLEGSTKD